MPGGQHTEVAQAYVTIIPSMQGAQKAISDGLTAMSVGEKAGKDLGSGIQKGLSTMKIAIGNTLGNLITRGMDTIMSGLSSGIQRYDTINNYPKVMQALGYSADDAADSIKRIQDHLDGLPTASDEMVRLTQSIADSTGDLDLATRAALGFNDMMLATGSSTADMTNASSMLNRILGKQSATVNQWASLQQYIPTQLSAIAEHMLGAGKSSEDLRLALEDGTVSWNDFLQAIVDLDENGTASMASFEDQARAMTGGIGTNIDNITNRISAGWQAIIEAIGGEGISRTIDTLSYGIRDGMKEIAGGITYLKDRIAESNIGENLSIIGQGIADFFAGLVDTETLKTFADAFVGFVDRGLQWVVDNGDLIVSFLSGVVGGVEAFMALKLIGTLMELPGLITAIWAVLSANPIVLVTTGVAALVAGLRYFFTETETGKAIWEGFCNGLSDLWEGVSGDFKSGLDTIKQNLEDNKVQWQTFKDNVIKSGAESQEAFTNFCKSVEDGINQYWKEGLETAAKQWEDWRLQMAESAEATREAATKKFEEIGQGIADKIQWAHDEVGKIVDGIKNLFDFDWSLPAPKLPHVKWHWNDIGGILSLPEFDGIEWYAKGAVFTAPTVAGLGEAGKEAALPLNRKTYQEIADGIASQMDTPDALDEDAITEAVVRAINMLGGLRITLDGRTMATALDSELGMLAFRGGFA